MPNNQSAANSRASGLISAQLGIDLKRNWIQWCSDRGLVPSKAMRSLVERVLAGDLSLDLAAPRSNQAVTAQVLEQPDRGAKVGREIQFTPSENAAIKAAATAQGYAFQDWVIAAVRAALAKAPSYGHDELVALTCSNAAMAQIAIELASLSRQDVTRLDLPGLAELEGQVRQHVETVSKLMAQGVQRWQLKV